MVVKFVELRENEAKAAMQSGKAVIAPSAGTINRVEKCAYRELFWRHAPTARETQALMTLGIIWKLPAARITCVRRTPGHVTRMLS